ncbi:hypothetical protein ACFFHU_08190 [Plantactinospora siamensis]|uniref:Uncharacterized protein n=2 Tax=Plantactinospora siamensis TaxID=555372 RepID=A0ABV6NV58_9ACTN
MAAPSPPGDEPWWKRKRRPRTMLIFGPVLSLVVLLGGLFEQRSGDRIGTQFVVLGVVMLVAWAVLIPIAVIRRKF